MKLLNLLVLNRFFQQKVGFFPMLAYESMYTLIQERMRTTRTEEDVRFGLESILTTKLPEMGINYNASYEKTIGNGRLDSLFGHIFFEYKKPGYLLPNFTRVVNEKKRYIPELARRLNCPEDRLAGVLFDGERIAFMRKDASGADRISDLYAVSSQSIKKLINYIHSLDFKALTAENILSDFGPKSNIAQQMILLLWQKFMNQKDTRTKLFFQEWIRLFGQTSGFGTGGEINLKTEAGLFGIQLLQPDDFPAFVFVLHTFYSIIIKMTALFILQHSREMESYSMESFQMLGDAKEKMNYIKNIENGELFKQLGILNFLEGDFFCWYVYEWAHETEKESNELCTGFDSIMQAFVSYEPSSASLKPEAVRDLLKFLYENLLIKSLRHDLGEYYTPDWLAEYTIRQSNMKPMDKVLDPACGSGTFLVLVIKMKIEKLTQDGKTKAEIATHLINNVYGFDLNPLAVIASRTNYILAINDYLDELSQFEIPVYLSDSIMSPQKKGSVYTYPLGTAHGIIELNIPEQVLLQGYLSSILTRIEHLVIDCSEGRIIDTVAIKLIYQYMESIGLAESAFEIIELYKKILELETKKWNRIWCKIIKNHYATVMMKDFDVLVGNPPWLKWSSLPENYRKVIKEFCVQYDLFSSDRFVGGIESDVSTILVYSAAEKWLKQGGTLSMLITRTVFKTKSAEGFRKFKLPKDENTKFQVISVEDFTNIKPFDGAINKPALMIFQKGTIGTSYPLPWIEWNATNKKMTTDMTLDEVMKITTRTELVAHPILGDGSPWLTVQANDLPILLGMRSKGTQSYVARKGISTDCNGLYFGAIIGNRGLSHVVFRNDPNLGRKEIPSSESMLEKNIIYPIARGRDVSAFHFNHSGLYGILPQDSMDGFPINEMMEKYYNTFNFLKRHQILLENRASYKRYHKQRLAPFYSVWNVGSYTFSPYKVAWAEISSSFEACVISPIMTPYWADDRLAIPDHKIYFVPLNDLIEAHYVCAYLNAPQVFEFVHGYIETTQIGSHITKYIEIPLYSNEKWQNELASISTSAHAGDIGAEEAKALITAVLEHSIKK